jgi:hypothetical protein
MLRPWRGDFDAGNAKAPCVIFEKKFCCLVEKLKNKKLL